MSAGSLWSRIKSMASRSAMRASSEAEKSGDHNGLLDGNGLEVVWNKMKEYVAEHAIVPSDITGNAATATKLKTVRTIGGVEFDGTKSIHHHGTCSTAGSTAAKTVSVTGFKLGTGAKITVWFRNKNTASNPTLNVSGTGAKPIYYKNARMGTNMIATDSVIELVYTGSYWRVVGELADNRVSEVEAQMAKTGIIYNNENIGQGITWSQGQEKIVATITISESGLYYIECTNQNTFGGSMGGGTAQCVAWMKLSNSDNSNFYRYRTFDYSGHADMMTHIDAGTYTIVIGMNAARTGNAPGRFGGLYVARLT